MASPRMHVELNENGVVVGRHRVARLMSENGLKARQKTRFKKTTDSDHGGPIATNVLDQDFTATAPEQKWGVDISYVWTAEGWLYLAIVLDLFSRRIVGWQLSDRMKRGLAMAALQRAINLRRPPVGLIHHSDRGSQYCSADYRRMLSDNGFVASMSGRGNCYDNAMVETVFKTIKSELIWRTAFTTREQASEAIGRYIEGFYNPRRRHSSLGYVSPVAFEAACRLKKRDEKTLSTKSGEVQPLSVSTLADQVGAGCAALESLLRRLEAHVFAAERLHGDDTTVPVLAKGKTITGRVWVYVRDGRPSGENAAPAAMFYYSRDRGGEHPRAHLAQWSGLLQADAYGGYTQLYEADRNRGSSSKRRAGRTRAGRSLHWPTSKRARAARPKAKHRR